MPLTTQTPWTHADNNILNASGILIAKCPSLQIARGIAAIGNSNAHIIAVGVPRVPAAAPSNFASIITEGRERKGWSQKTFGIYAGVTQMTISNWERGKHTPSPLEWKGLQDILA